MISPTEQGIRNDSEGSGVYGSSRGNRRHMGSDFLSNPFQNIVAPCNMFIERIAKPKANSNLSGIAWRSESMTGKMFYFLPNQELIGHPVHEGEIIGVAQDLKKEYSENMKSHIHLQIDSIDPMIIINLCKFANKF